MKIFALLFCFTFLLANAANSIAQIPHRTYAIVIGISKYENVPSLNFADKDAITFFNYLLSPAGDISDTNDIKIFLNKNATSYNIVAAMEFLLNNVKENDKVYFYFAGHGDVESKTAYKMGYLICYSSPKTCYPAGGCLDMNYLQNFAKTLTDRKANVILILDACRAGKLLTGGEDGKQAFSVAVNEWTGLTKILSCQPGESSYENNNLGVGGAGVFTYHLVRGLKGLADFNHDNYVALKEIRRYLEDSVEIYTRNERKPQNPSVCCDLNNIVGKVDYKILKNLINGVKDTSNLSIIENNSSFNPDASEINAEDVLIEYDRFNTYLKANKLIKYANRDNSDSNALFIFDKLKNNKNAKPVINSMKNSLVAALMNNAQESMNNWINNIDIPDDNIKSKETLMELNAAIRIIDSNFYSYKHILATYLMWNYDTIKVNDNKERKIRECIELEPNNPIFYYDLANFYSDNKKYDSSLKTWNLVLNLAPNWLGANFNKGLVLRNLDKLEESINSFKKYLEIKPNDPWAHYQIGQNYYKLKKFDKAAVHFDSTLIVWPNYLDAYILKGLAHLNCNNYIQALSCFDRALGLKSNFDIAIYNKACVYSKMKDKEKMLATLRNAIERNNIYKAMATKDEDFKDYWNDPDFIEMIK